MVENRSLLKNSFPNRRIQKPKGVDMANPKPLILVVEDDKQIAQMVAEQLEFAGMLTQVCYRGANALRFLEHNFANLILLDVNLPDQTGFALVEDMKKANQCPGHFSYGGQQRAL